MAKRALRKNINVFLACAVVGTIMVGSTPAFALSTNQTKDNVITTQKNSQKRNVMYYGDWSIWGGENNFYPKDIPADKLTHLNYAFMDFDSNGNLIFTDKGAACEAPVGMEGVTWGDSNAGLLCAFQELKAKNPNLKIGISLGGWSKSGDFSDVAASPQKTNQLVENVLSFVRYTNMDFVDLDWEYPTAVREADLVDNQNDEGTPHGRPADRENYIKLLKAFRAGLDKQGKELGKTYELSVALPAPIAKIDSGIDVKNLFNVVDFANIMTYDMRGSWDPITGHQTGLYTNPKDPYKGKGLSVDESVKHLINQGADPSKIVVGAAYYSRGWEKSVGKNGDKDHPGLFNKVEKVNKDADRTPTSGAKNGYPCKVGDGGRLGGVWAFRSQDKLRKEYPGLKEYWDDTAKAPYLYDAKTGAFFTFDNVRSVKEKCNYVNNNKLGGMIAWMSSQDAPINGSSVRGELTTASKEGLFGKAPLKEYNIVYDDLDITCTIKPFKESWSDKGGYTLTIKNNEQKNEKGEVLSSVEKTAETIKNAKIYIKTNGINITSGDYTTGNITNKDGYTIIDLGSLYSGKLIDQGATYQMTLNTNVAPKDLSGISEIYMTQRMSEKGPEIGKQELYKNNNSTTPVKPNKPTVPTKPEKPITPEKPVTPEKPTTPTKPVTPEKPVVNVKDTYSSSKIYNGGETVVYKGQKYKAKWWTQGELPGQSDVWQKL